MSAFLLEPELSRRQAFEEIGIRMDLVGAGVEKDFWVCWTLRELLRVPDIGEHLTFKGGTSLSKAWGLIERFSEDLDLVVDRDVLGFDGERAPGAASSRKQRERRLEQLRFACGEWVRGPLLSGLAHRIAGDQVASSGQIFPDPTDPDGATLLYQYPSIVDASDYLSAEVRLEFGARSEIEPHAVRTVCSYLHEKSPTLDPDTVCKVRVVAPERTFWEKACLLHEENARPQARRIERLSRHFYDVWCLIRHGVGERALADIALFDRVITHRRIYFRQSWMDDAAYRQQSFRLVPPPDRVDAWRDDYESMRKTMFLSEPPAFDEIMLVVGTIEARLRLTGLRPGA